MRVTLWRTRGSACFFVEYIVFLIILPCITQDMWVYLSESSVFRSFNDEENSLVWHEEALELGNYNEPEKTKDLVYKPSQVSIW